MKPYLLCLLLRSLTPLVTQRVSTAFLPGSRSYRLGTVLEPQPVYWKSVRRGKGDNLARVDVRWAGPCNRDWKKKSERHFSGIPWTWNLSFRHSGTIQHESNTFFANNRGQKHRRSIRIAWNRTKHQGSDVDSRFSLSFGKTSQLFGRRGILFRSQVSKQWSKNLPHNLNEASIPQDLTITVSTERSEFEIDLEEDHSDISGINVQSFVDEQEWRLHNHVETWKKVTTKVFQNTKYKHPALSAACKASRRPGFFIWNIFFVMVSRSVEATGVSLCHLLRQCSAGGFQNFMNQLRDTQHFSCSSSFVAWRSRRFLLTRSCRKIDSNFPSFSCSQPSHSNSSSIKVYQGFLTSRTWWVGRFLKKSHFDEDSKQGSKWEILLLAMEMDLKWCTKQETAVRPAPQGLCLLSSGTNTCHDMKWENPTFFAISRVSPWTATCTRSTRKKSAFEAPNQTLIIDSPKATTEESHKLMG